MTAFWVFSGLFVAAFAGILLTIHLCEPPEYRRRMYRTSRARRLERTLHATITGPWARVLGGIWSLWDPHMMACLGWFEYVVWDRLHRPHLPRRPVRDLPAEDAGPAAIPPTETPEPDVCVPAGEACRGCVETDYGLACQADLGGQCASNYSDTSADWAEIREQLFAMLAEDGAP